MIAPRLLAAKLSWRNRRARARLGGSLTLLFCGSVGALLLVERVAADAAFGALRAHGMLCAGLAALAAAVLVARRRSLERARFVRSWLAAVPIHSSAARWEALLIETSPASMALGLLAFLGLTASLLSTRRADIVVAWMNLSGGVVLGALIGYLIPAPKPVELPPGSRYVPHRLSGRRTALRPSLAALGHWPIRQLFAWAQPKAVSRAVIPILVMMPLGTTADTAMIVIILFGVACAPLLAWAAVLAVTRLARRWLAPLPLRTGAIIRAVLLPACAFVLAACALGALLLLALTVPR